MISIKKYKSDHFLSFPFVSVFSHSIINNGRTHKEIQRRNCGGGWDQEESDFNFFTWVKRRIQTVNHNVIIIDKVVVVGQFKCKEKQKVIEENLDTLTHGFRGN